MRTLIGTSLRTAGLSSRLYARPAGPTTAPNGGEAGRFWAIVRFMTRSSETSPLRLLAEQALSRTAGAPLLGGNAIRLLRDAEENYPAWLAAIAGARQSVLFENYIVHD